MWKFFDKEHPEEGEFITIIWSNGSEDDCIWSEDGMIWEISDGVNIPICWKEYVVYDSGMGWDE